MAKKTIQILSIVLIPVLLAVGVLIGYRSFLVHEISARYNSALGRTYGVDEMNKGIALLRHNAEKGDLILLGSSELSADIPQNPKNYFPNVQMDSDISLVGRAYVQSGLNSVKVGALSEELRGKKVAIIISLQWFLGEEIDKAGFNAHLSEIQFYKMMHNKDISDDVKRDLCKRVVDLAANEPSLEIPYLYARLYQSDTFLSKVGLAVMKPYYWFREKFLDVKDLYKAYRAVEKFEGQAQQEVRAVDWAEEMRKAQKMGEDSCHNNDIYVYDEYYTTYLEPKWERLKNSYKNVDLLSSKELSDYETFLKVCKQTGVQPYIIFMPTNGWYYDYLGITKEKRGDYYDRLAELAEKYDLPYLDLREKEYEPYFLKDVMHLGWKGWLYVNEQITKHFEKAD
ncbi:MAG: D-alanyl-lipoteichoic acid biosynthesis protein DltD [Oscillospiraceae bacterium]